MINWKEKLIQGQLRVIIHRLICNEKALFLTFCLTHFMAANM